MRCVVFVHGPLSILLLFSMTLWAFGQGTPDDLSIPSKKVKISGVNVHFMEAGKGLPILFLHGVGGSWRDWSANLPAFAATYWVVAMDFPGFGEFDYRLNPEGLRKRWPGLSPMEGTVRFGFDEG